jgi:NAD+--asparagine ADP-ribosyltransferase
MKNLKLIENFVNGNISDAKKAAKRVTFEALKESFTEYGFSDNKAQASMMFLKNKGSFQDACDAE